MKYAEVREGVVFVKVKGSFNIKAAMNLEEELNGYLDMGEKKFFFDFSETDYIDSTGLGVLITLKERLDEMNGEVVLSGLKGNCLEIFKATRLNEEFDIQNEEKAS
jgi:anti-sigma B factor antagonist